MTFNDLVPLLGVGIEGLVGSNEQTPETQCGRRVFYLSRKAGLAEKGNRKLELLCSVS